MNFPAVFLQFGVLMKKFNFKTLVLTAALLFSMPRSASATEYVVNGDFSANGSGWTSEGLVFFGGGFSASLSDAGNIPGVCDSYGCSRLYQGVALTPGTYSLQFDFLAFLSPVVNQQGTFTFPDFFNTSLFLTDSATFSPDAPPADLPASPGPSLFAYQFDGGASDVASGATFSPSGANFGWTHFSLNFTTSKGYAYILFELFGLDFISGNASVLFDNVSIASNGDSAVPEPATLALFSMGALGALGRRKKSR